MADRADAVCWVAAGAVIPVFLRQILYAPPLSVGAWSRPDPDIASQDDLSIWKLQRIMMRGWLVLVHAPEASQALPSSFERLASCRVNVERKFGRLDPVLRGAHAPAPALQAKARLPLRLARPRPWAGTARNGIRGTLHGAWNLFPKHDRADARPHALPAYRQKRTSGSLHIPGQFPKERML